MLLRVDQYLLSCATNIDRIADVIRKLEPWQAKIAVGNLHDYQAQILALMQESADSDFVKQLSRAQEGHDLFKAGMLEAGARGDVDFDTIVACMEMLGEWLRLIQQWIKAMKQLAHIATQAAVTDKRVAEEIVEGELLPGEKVEPDKVAGLESGSPDA
jgi:hypothetical protein